MAAWSVESLAELGAVLWLAWSIESFAKQKGSFVAGAEYGKIIRNHILFHNIKIKESIYIYAKK